MSPALDVTAATSHAPRLDEQRFEMAGIPWDLYVRMADAIPDHAGTWTIFLDGSLTFVTTARRHDALSDALSDLVKAVAVETRAGFAVGGRATYRRSERGAGGEGDQTFYFGENARRMRGNVNIDLAAQPPPDLAIEVEVTNPTDLTIAAWGRLGVPEVWHFHVDSWTLTFLARQLGRLLCADAPQREPPGIDSGGGCGPPSPVGGVGDLRLVRWAAGLGPRGAGSAFKGGGLMGLIGFNPPSESLAGDALDYEWMARIKVELAPGERLLWAGPAGLASLPPFAWRTWGIWLIGLVAIGPLAVVARSGVLGPSVRRFSEPWLANVSLGCLFFYAVTLFQSLKETYDDRRTRRGLVYALTDRRAIRWEQSPRSRGVAVSTLAGRSIGSVRRVEYSGDVGDVEFVANVPLGEFRGFLGVRDVRRVESIAREILVNPQYQWREPEGYDEE